MQSTLTSFVVGAGAQRHAWLEEDASLEWRRAQTARLLLPWPSVRARRVGRPSRRLEWRERLGQLIDAMDRIVEELGPDPPAWWQRGQPMQLTMATVGEHSAVQDDIASAAAEPAGGEAVGDGAGYEKPAEPCTKRRKTHVPLPHPRQAQLVHGAVLSLRRKGTSILLRAPAQRLAPQVVPAEDFQYRWSPALPETRSCPGFGRPRAPRLQQSMLWRRSVGTTPERPSGHTWCSLPLLRSPVPQIHAVTWVLLQETQGRARKGVARSNDTELNDAGITDRSRVINIDETCCKMLPLLERGWLAGGEQHVVMDTRRNITVFLATRHLKPDVYAQFTFQGRTSAVEPPNPYPSLLTTSHLESHWTTPSTLTAFLTWLDTTVMNPDGLTAPWICLMDVYTVLVYVPPSTTAVCQPLDRSYMRPFKAALGRISARHVGREIRHHPDDIANITHSIAGLRSLLMTWTHDALQEIATMHHNTAAWSDIVCSPTEQLEVLALATARHIAGTVFKPHRGHPAQLHTDAAVEEVDDNLVDEDPPVPHMFPDLFQEEEDEPELPV